MAELKVAFSSGFNNCFTDSYPEVLLEPSQTSIMEIHCKNT